MSDIWYYAQDDKPIGPLSLIDLKKVLSLISDAKNVSVWRSDFVDWKKAESVEELVAAVVRPPPIKPANDSPPPVQPTQAAASSALSEGASEKRKKREMFVAVRRAGRLNKILAGLTAALVGCLVWRYHLMQELQVQVLRYGWGHVPQEMMPQGINQIDWIIWPAATCWVLGIVPCVMYCFYQIRWVLQTRFGQHFKYSFGWTVFSLFIPFVWFVRPWLGLGEIRRKMIAARRDGATPMFDFYTLAFALTFILGVVAMGSIGRTAADLAKTADSSRDVDSIINLNLAYAAVILVVGLVGFGYCRSVVVGVRQAMANDASATEPAEGSKVLSRVTLLGGI
jgi:hypothetical protein